jgi:hypothetical protein
MCRCFGFLAASDHGAVLYPRRPPKPFADVFAVETLAGSKPTDCLCKHNQSTIPDDGTALAGSETTQIPMSTVRNRRTAWIECAARLPHLRSS